ncbi:hypothetical protein B0I35DRAFT_404682 [Stachybotrys elegans]|uniref:Zn(2)-C6 fungal-type domain-containing protein n=1 Tax=Stachybotrys elegans TaxID=80388 RepID=A0A8K0T423_9HYPO|nr:hypothetical protein B0I35DRAFT_404682 [Stachybotrys elegans]
MEESPASLGPADARNPRPSPRGTASYQRRRAVTACQVCRARRTKCDNLKPSCSFCLKTGATCVQSPVDLSSFDPASLKILERLDELEQLLKASSSSRTYEHEERAHKRRAVDPVEPEPTRSSPVSTGRCTSLMSSLDDIFHSWPILRALDPQDVLLSDASPGRYGHSGVLAQSPVDAVGLLDLEPLRVKDLLDNFFNYVHVKNPIFDERATRRTVQTTIINGIDWSPESCLSLLICALGSIATPFGPSYDVMPGTTAYSNALSFFQAAQKRLGTLLCSDDILASQCLFLSGVFLMCVFQDRKAWRYFIQALAHCQQLSFLSPGSQKQYFSSLDDGTETHDFDWLHQAIYWSSWKSEREIRNHLTLPDFSPNDHGLALYPGFFPTPPAPQSEEASSDVGRQREQTSWYFYLAEISLRRLAARIGDALETMHKTHQTRQRFLHAVAAAIPSFEAQVQDWVDSLPSFLSFDAPAAEDDVCRFVLRGHAINLYEVIYWPFLSAHLDGSIADPAQLSPFIQLAQTAIDYHVSRLKVNEPGYRHRHHGTSPMLSSCSRSTMILIAVWRQIQTLRGAGHGSSVLLTLPEDWRMLAERWVKTLEYWAPEIPRIERVRQVLSQGLRWEQQ